MIEAAMAAEAARERGPDLPPITMTGAQRKVLADSIGESIAEHQRTIRTSKIFRDRQRVQTVIDQLSRSLAMVNRGEVGHG